MSDNRKRLFNIFYYFLLAILFLPTGVFAADLVGRSRTFLSAKETVFNENILKVYEYVDLSLYNIGKKDISFHASGWGRYDIENLSGRDRQEGELAYAYVDVPVKAMNARFRLGRQFVFAGAASEQIDGTSITTRISGFGASLFAGSPPELDIDHRGGDSILGWRLSHQKKGLYEVGASYLKEDNDSTDFREEYGADLWLKPAKWLSLQGTSTYNEITSGWMEHTYRLTAAKSGKLKAYAEYSMVDYGHFFNASTMTAFSNAFVDSQESYSASSLGIEYKPGDSMNYTIRYKSYSYDIAGDADSYGGGVVYTKGSRIAGLSVDRTNGDTEKLRYYMYRAFASFKVKKLDITGDLTLLDYDAKTASTDQTLSATGAIGYRLKDNLRTGLELTYEENPLFNSETRALLKLNYRFGAV